MSGPRSSASRLEPSWASTTSSRRSTLAGYERVERVEERGQIAVRGGLVDVFPSTGREPLRIEFFGDEIEQIRAFSPFTQRALHAVDEAVVYPARERRTALDDLEGREALEAESDRVPLLERTPDLVWQVDDVMRAWEEDGTRACRRSRARPDSTRSRARSRTCSRRSVLPSPRAGSPRPRTSSRRW